MYFAFEEVKIVVLPKLPGLVPISLIWMSVEQMQFIARGPRTPLADPTAVHFQWTPSSSQLESPFFVGGHVGSHAVLPGFVLLLSQPGVG